MNKNKTRKMTSTRKNRVVLGARHMTTRATIEKRSESDERIERATKVLELVKTLIETGTLLAGLIAAVLHWLLPLLP